MIVVTGGLGFIGANLVKKLQQEGFDVVVKDVKTETLTEIRNWFIKNNLDITAIFHMGAITDTQEYDTIKLDQYNYSFSIFMWNYSALHNIPLIYASSAATYGDGKSGYSDESIYHLKPLNPYGVSKQKFDEFAISAGHKPKHWYGLKFFNVYGFNEYDKINMASMVFHGYNQIKFTNKIKLFKSYNNKFLHGEQARDFIYVDDVVDICMFFLNKKPKSGIYNVGTGIARTFNDLGKIIFKSLGKEENISYIDMPDDLKNTYQYFTQAKIDKLRNVGYDTEFHDLEDGISKYVQTLNNI